MTPEYYKGANNNVALGSLVVRLGNTKKGWSMMTTTAMYGNVRKGFTIKGKHMKTIEFAKAVTV